MKNAIVQLARRSLPLMNPTHRAEAERLINFFDRTPNAVQDESLAAFSRRAGAAFEKDMQPVCSAIVASLKANDLGALKGLRAMLPHLLVQVNAAPALSDLLAHQLGSALLQGFRMDPSETTANAYDPGEARNAHGSWTKVTIAGHQVLIDPSDPQGTHANIGALKEQVEDAGYGESDAADEAKARGDMPAHDAHRARQAELETWTSRLGYSHVAGEASEEAADREKTARGSTRSGDHEEAAGAHEDAAEAHESALSVAHPGIAPYHQAQIPYHRERAAEHRQEEKRAEASETARDASIEANRQSKVANRTNHEDDHAEAQSAHEEAAEAHEVAQRLYAAGQKRREQHGTLATQHRANAGAHGAAATAAEDRRNAAEDLAEEAENQSDEARDEGTPEAHRAAAEAHERAATAFTGIDRQQERYHRAAAGRHRRGNG